MQSLTRQERKGRMILPYRSEKTFSEVMETVNICHNYFIKEGGRYELGTKRILGSGKN